MCICGKDGNPLHSMACPACSKALVDKVADAIAETMFAPHELPLDAELKSKYRATARAAIKAIYNG